MADLISKCPKCETVNKVTNTVYMQLDKGAPVICEKCALRFCATLSEQDAKTLFAGDSFFPTVKGKKDYLLKSEFYPNP